MINNFLPTRQSRQSGSTMLEVLISIVVLSFGMLGMLGLIINGVKMSSSSRNRSIAAEQFSTMVEIIKANPYAISTYDAAASTTINSDCFKTAACTGTVDMPPTEYGVWQARLKDALGPSGKGTVCRDSTPADGTPGAWACDGIGRTTIKICWSESQVSSATNWSTACFSSQI